MTSLRSITFVLLLFRLSSVATWAQHQEAAPLFQNETPLGINLVVSLAEIRKNKSDSTYFSTTLRYKNPQATWDSIRIDVRARGNFRRKHCFFPPIRIKINKHDSKGTPFEGSKNLKLVLPCQPDKSFNELVLKEYVCYQLYEPITLYAFNTRLADVTLTDVSGKRPKTYQLTGILVEDDDVTARRLRAAPVDESRINPLRHQDTCVLRFDLYQYMIANTDFSTAFSHNVKTMKTDDGRYIPIPYDFDMAGFVNAPYATFDESLGIKSVHERVYKGYCRNEAVAQFVRHEYIGLEPQILAVLDRFENQFDRKEFAIIKKYMNDFFTTLKNDSFYRDEIIRKCRTPR